MDEESQQARRAAWLEGAPGEGEIVVPVLGVIVRDAAMAARPGRVVDWDGADTLTLEPPAGGVPWTARLADVGPDRGSGGQGRNAERLRSELDGDPLGLAVLARVLRAARHAAEEEVGLSGTDGHDILTVTDTIRDRQLRSGALPGVAWIDDEVRLQVARAVAMVVYAVVPDDPVAALLRWQRAAGADRRALARVIGTAADRVAAVASISRMEAALAGMEAAPDAADDDRL